MIIPNPGSTACYGTSETLRSRGVGDLATDLRVTRPLLWTNQQVSICELFFCFQNQKKVRSFDIRSAKRQQEDKNRFAASLTSIRRTYCVMYKML